MDTSVNYGRLASDAITSTPVNLDIWNFSCRLLRHTGTHTLHSWLLQSTTDGHHSQLWAGLLLGWHKSGLFLWTNSNLAINQGKLFCIIFLKKKWWFNPPTSHFVGDRLPQIHRNFFFGKNGFSFLGSQKIRKKSLIPMIYNTLVKCLRKRVKKFKIHYFWAKWPNL